MSGGLRVVIPTATFGAHLDGLLADLSANLTRTSGLRAQVLVVDAAAIYDVTPALAGSGPMQVTSWPSPSNGPAINRNRGAKGCPAPWLMFLDDDTRLEENWAEHWLSLLNDPETPDLVGGGIGSQRPRNWFSQAAEDFVVRHREYPEGWYLAAAHLAVRTSAFTELEGFRDRFGYGAEDWDICRRAHAVGLRVGVTSDAMVFHRNATNWRALKLKAVQYGRANATFDSDVIPTSTSSADVPAQAGGGSLPARAARWVRAEYSLLRSTGRSRRRALRSTALYIPWMAAYLRAARLQG